MVIDCETCIARPRACGDCVVTHLLTVQDARGHPRNGAGPHDGGWPKLALDDADVVAVATMAAAGLVPPLRLVPAAHPSNGATPPAEVARYVTRRDDAQLRAIG